METTTRSSNIGLTYGLITGLIVCIITLLQYLGGITTYLSPIGFVVYLVLIVIAVLAGLKQKKLNGGYLEFGEAIRPGTGWRTKYLDFLERYFDTV